LRGTPDLAEELLGMLHWVRKALCRGYQEAKSNSNRPSPTELTLPAEKQIEQ
jgi:hypothetical protein